jgi:hypothetical protein
MLFGQRNQLIESSPRHNLDCPTRRERMSISFHNGTILTRRPQPSYFDDNRCWTLP